MNYFKNENLKLLFDALKEKYIKTSKLTGIISIIPSVEEANKIGRFLGIHLKTKEKNKIQIKQIETAINKSKFEGTELLAILKYLYGDIITNKEKRTQEEIKRNLLLENLKEAFQDTELSKWLEDNLKDKTFYQKTMHLLSHDKNGIYNILYALLNLPFKNNNYMNLSIFSSKITGDPHYFDLENTHNHDLMWFIEKLLNIKVGSTRKSKVETLSMVGIYIDSISNFIITYNLQGTDYLNELSKRGEVAILSLDNIDNLENVFAMNKKVIILENPSILNIIMAKKVNSAFVITSGNPNTACYTLLDKLSTHELYYNGDFDPEGLLIADKLSKKYTNITLIGYTKKLYEKAKSNKKLSLSRIKKLDAVTTEKLKEIKEQLIITNSPGYQEKIIDDLLKMIIE